MILVILEPSDKVCCVVGGLALKRCCHDYDRPIFGEITCDGVECTDGRAEAYIEIVSAYHSPRYPI